MISAPQYGEAEVAGRHCEVSLLRVVKANRNAIRFYIKHGWNIEKEFQHETLPIEMLELSKRFPHSPGKSLCLTMAVS